MRRMNRRDARSPDAYRILVVALVVEHVGSGQPGDDAAVKGGFAERNVRGFMLPHGSGLRGWSGAGLPAGTSQGTRVTLSRSVVGGWPWRDR